jgi:signal transduction histidine kinase
METLLVIFVGISTIALVFQAAMLYGTYKASRTLQERITPLVPKIDALVETSRAAIEENTVKLREITDKTNQILDTAKRQMVIVEDLLEDASTRTHRQLERAEILVDDALERTQDTIAMVHQGILKPLRGITGIAAGLRAALQFLMRGGRPSPDRATVDEEMFI